MKTRELFFVFLSLLIASCTHKVNNSQFPNAFPNESFQDLDPSDFNTKIKTRKDIKTGKELIQLFYPARIDKNTEGKQTIDITTSEVDGGHQKIVLIHDYMLDDSQKSIKLIMIAQKTNDIWQVKLLKKNWQCWPNRGHSDWGTELCN